MSSKKISELITKGNACFQQDKLKDAAECYRHAIELDPGSFAAHANYGNTLLRLDRFDGAITAYLDALKLKPKAPLVARNLGECYENTNRLSDAEQYYRLSIQVRPDDAETYVDLGNAYQKQGNRDGALQSYRKALEINRKLSSAQHNIGLSLYDDRDLSLAEGAFSLAIEMDSGNAKGACFLAVILEHQGKHAEADKLFRVADKGSKYSACLIDSARYAFKKGKDARYFSNTADVLRFAVSESDQDGLFMEFGVYFGFSLNTIARSTGSTVHGFDSFEGLPESWFVGEEKGPLATEPSGAYTTKGFLPNVPENVELHVGWFEDTLPPFMESQNDYASFINIDCDIYSSTKTIFDSIQGRLRHGTIIVFDEYFCYPEWRDHEYKAFQELMSDIPFRYEYIAFSYFTGQAVVRLLES